MPGLGEAKLTLRVAGEKFKSGLNAAKGQATTFGNSAEKSANKAKTAFGNMATKAKGAAGQIPIIGGALSGLATPAGAATAVIGLAVGALTKMVTKALDLGRNLGEAREALNVSAESIQIWRRAIEETNGKAESFDKVVLRLQKSIGEAGTGNKQYAEDFGSIGLKWQDLATMSPEDALLAVLTATNDNATASDGAALKAGLLGRSYTDMGGLANDSGEDIRKMLDSVSESAVVMGGDAVTSVDEYDAAMRDMRDTFGKISIAIGTTLIPKITTLVTAFMSIAEAVWPVIDVLTKPMQAAFDLNIKAVDALAKLIKGDFSGAWNAAKETAVGALSGIIEVYNSTIAKIPGVAKIDMDAVRDALGVVSDAANDDLKPALEDVGTALGETADSTGGLTTATDDLATSEQTAADRVADTKQAILDHTTAVDSAEDAISGGMLPTLDDLEAKLQDEATAADDAAQATKDHQAAIDDLTPSVEELRQQLSDQATATIDANTAIGDYEASLGDADTATLSVAEATAEHTAKVDLQEAAADGLT